jgi:phosphoglycolate phosphatase-like HAD superfamily hydrolase
MHKESGNMVSLSCKFRSFKADCALFDVDGVIVDIRKSYDCAIKKTVDFVIKEITKMSNLNGLVNQEMILKFRQTGGFNNDVDTSYAIILASLANPNKHINQMRKFIFTIIRNINESGIASVERFLSSFFSSVEKVKELLNYPGPVGQSIVSTVFDEIFYGAKLFERRYRLKPKYYFGKPLIENDKLVATKSTVNALSRLFKGNIAIVSGRSKLAAEYSLKPIFNTFNLDASIFLEDEDRQYSKPSTYGIKRAMRVMKAKNAIYAGDSREDLLMSRMLEKETGVKITFLGIYGCSINPKDTIRLFRENGADLIIKSVNQVPNVLNKAFVEL